MAKDLSDRKIERESNKSLKNIGKCISKLLESKGGIENLKELVSSVVAYNIYDVDPRLLVRIPKIVVEDLNRKNTRGSYTYENNTLYINEGYYNLDTIKEHPERMQELLCTVSHEMRHWYQYIVSSRQIDKDLKNLILSGKDELLESASKTIKNQFAISVEDFEKMYADVDREDLLKDIRALRMSSDDIRIGINPYDNLSFLQEDDDVMKILEDKSDDYLRLYLATTLNWAQYSSQHCELDARLTGTAESINIITALSQSKDKEVKNWASGIDIRQIMDKELNSEESKFNDFEAYNNFAKILPMERLSQMMEKIDDYSVYHQFNEYFLNDKSDKEIEKLMAIGLAKGCQYLMQEDYDRISKDTLRKMFDNNTVTDFQDNEMRISQAGFKQILDLLGDDLTDEEKIEKSKSLLLEGDFKKIGLLKSSISGFNQVIEFADKMDEFADENIDKICQLVENGTIKENDLNTLSQKTLTKHAKEINEARIEQMLNIQKKIDEGKLNEVQLIVSTRETMGNLNLLLKNGENKEKIGDASSYLKTVEQYIETLQSLGKLHKEKLSDEEREFYEQKDNDPSMNELYEQYKNDDNEISQLLSEVDNSNNWNDLALYSKYLLGVLGEKAKQIKENLKEEVKENQDSQENKEEMEEQTNIEEQQEQDKAEEDEERFSAE